MLGRYEYQEGNIEAALHVFEGINIAALTPKIKVFLAKSTERPKRRSQNYTTPPMSIHTAGLLLEAIFLKAKCLQVLARFEGTLIDCLIFAFNLIILLNIPSSLFEHSVRYALLEILSFPYLFFVQNYTQKQI